MAKKVLKFSATWCNPCKAYEPIFEQVSKENPDIEFKEIDIEQNEDLAEEYNIMSVPTTIVLLNEVPVKRLSGALTKKQLEDLIND